VTERQKAALAAFKVALQGLLDSGLDIYHIDYSGWNGVGVGENSEDAKAWAGAGDFAGPYTTFAVGSHFPMDDEERVRCGGTPS